VALAAAQTRPQPKPIPKGAYAHNFEYVGFTDLNGHLPFKIDIQQINGRWYMYAGAQTDRGWSIIDVTDPATPKVLNWIPGPKNTRSGELDIADGKLITAAEPRRWAATPIPTRRGTTASSSGV